MGTTQARAALRKATNISLDQVLLAEAMAPRIDGSKAAEAGLARAKCRSC